MVAIFDIRAVLSASPTLLGIQTSSASEQKAGTSFANLFNEEFAPELPLNPIENQDFQQVHLDTDLHMLALLAFGTVPQQPLSEKGTEILLQDMPVIQGFPFQLFPLLEQQAETNESSKFVSNITLFSSDKNLIEQSIELLKNASQADEGTLSKPLTVEEKNNAGGEKSTLQLDLAESSTTSQQADSPNDNTSLWGKAYSFVAQLLQRESQAISTIADGNIQTTLQTEANGMSTVIMQAPEHATSSVKTGVLPTLTVPPAENILREHTVSNNSLQALVQEFQAEGETIQVLTVKVQPENNPLLVAVLPPAKDGIAFEATDKKSGIQYLPEHNTMALSRNNASTLAELALLAQKQRFLSALKKNSPENEPIFHEKSREQLHSATIQKPLFSTDDGIIADEQRTELASETKASTAAATPSIWELATKKEQLLENLVPKNHRESPIPEQQPTVTAGQYSAATIASGERAAADKKLSESRKYATAFGIMAGNSINIGERTDIHPIHDAESVKKDIQQEEAQQFTEQQDEIENQSADAEIVMPLVQPEAVHSAIQTDISFVPEIHLHGATPEKAATVEQIAQKLYTGETTLPRMYPADLPATVVAALRTKPQGGVLRLALNPSELGNITLRVSVQNSDVHIRMLVETPEAKAIMEERVEAMKETLRAIGLECDTIEIRQREESENEVSARTLQTATEHQQGEKGRESGTQYREHKEYLKTMKTLWNLHSNSPEQQRILRRA